MPVQRSRESRRGDDQGSNIVLDSLALHIPSDIDHMPYLYDSWPRRSRDEQPKTRRYLRRRLSPHTERRIRLLLGQSPEEDDDDDEKDAYGNPAPNFVISDFYHDRPPYIKKKDLAEFLKYSSEGFCRSKDSPTTVAYCTVYGLKTPFACFRVAGEPLIFFPSIMSEVSKQYNMDDFVQLMEDFRINLKAVTYPQLQALRKVRGLHIARDAEIDGDLMLIKKSDVSRIIGELVSSSAKEKPPDDLHLKTRNSFVVGHLCFGACEGTVYPELNRIQCNECKYLFRPDVFVTHNHQTQEIERVIHWGFIPENWRDYINLRPDDMRRQDVVIRFTAFINEDVAEVLKTRVPGEEYIPRFVNLRREPVVKSLVQTTAEEEEEEATEAPPLKRTKLQARVPSPTLVSDSTSKSVSVPILIPIRKRLASLDPSFDYSPVKRQTVEPFGQPAATATATAVASKPFPLDDLEQSAQSNGSAGPLEQLIAALQHQNQLLPPALVQTLLQAYNPTSSVPPSTLVPPSVSACDIDTIVKNLQLNGGTSLDFLEKESSGISKLKGITPPEQLNNLYGQPVTVCRATTREELLDLPGSSKGDSLSLYIGDASGSKCDKELSLIPYSNGFEGSRTCKEEESGALAPQTISQGNVMVSSSSPNTMTLWKADPMAFVRSQDEDVERALRNLPPEHQPSITVAICQYMLRNIGRLNEMEETNRTLQMKHQTLLTQYALAYFKMSKDNGGVPPTVAVPSSMICDANKSPQGNSLLPPASQPLSIESGQSSSSGLFSTGLQTNPNATLDPATLAQLLANAGLSVPPGLSSTIPISSSSSVYPTSYNQLLMSSQPPPQSSSSSSSLIPSNSQLEQMLAQQKLQQGLLSLSAPPPPTLPSVPSTSVDAMLAGLFSTTGSLVSNPGFNLSLLFSQNANPSTYNRQE